MNTMQIININCIILYFYSVLLWVQDVKERLLKNTEAQYIIVVIPFDFIQL